MKTIFTIACRGSKLSLAQVEIFKKKVLKYFPFVEFNINIQSTRGDRIQDVPLDTLAGKDFFTQEIQSQLIHNGNDFAVHSMKDISSLDFFEGSKTAVIDRGLVQDVAIFTDDIIDKLKSGKEIIIGTSSPRRALAGKAFLEKVLPKFNGQPTKVTTKLIRGNVDTRLDKLNTQDYDGIILALTGINRLLSDAEAANSVNQLLQQKQFMLMSLFSCPPAANQGALIVETRADNIDACHILATINDPHLEQQTQQEREITLQYGHEGCSQMFGVYAGSIRDIEFVYAAGNDLNEQPFTHWNFESLSSSETDDVLYFKDLTNAFEYKNETTKPIDKSIKTIFVTHKRTLHQADQLEVLNQKKIWAAGVNTWQALANKGIWVEGCSDGLGLQYLEKIWENSFLNHSIDQTAILTNSMSKIHYPNRFKHVIGTYALTPTNDENVIQQLQKAKAIFWTSFQQYDAYRAYLRDDVKHLCPAGRTATLLIKNGVNPIIFPTINAFKTWKTTL